MGFAQSAYILHCMIFHTWADAYLHHIKQLVNLFIHTFSSVLSMWFIALKPVLKVIMSFVLWYEIFDSLKFPQEYNLAHKHHGVMVIKKSHFN